MTIEGRPHDGQRHGQVRAESLLGAILIQAGVIAPSALDRVLKRRWTGRLGDRLVEEGLCRRADVDAALRRQVDMASQVGQILVRSGVIRQGDLDRVVDLGGPGRLGDRLVAAGLCSRADVDAALRDQIRLTSRLGEILVRAGIIGRNALADALDRAAVSGASVGATLVAMGLVAEETIRWALAVQSRLRQALPIVVLGFGVTVTGAKADTALEGHAVFTAAAEVVSVETVTIRSTVGDAGTVLGAAGPSLSIKLPADSAYRISLVGPNDGQAYLADARGQRIRFSVVVETEGLGRHPLRPGMSLQGGRDARITIDVDPDDRAATGAAFASGQFTFVFDPV